MVEALKEAERKELCGRSGYSINIHMSKPDGTPRKLLDVSRLDNLGWMCQVELGQGLETNYQWYFKKLDHGAFRG